MRVRIPRALPLGHLTTLCYLLLSTALERVFLSCTFHVAITGFAAEETGVQRKLTPLRSRGWLLKGRHLGPALTPERLFAIGPLHSDPSQGDMITDGRWDHRDMPKRGQGFSGSMGWRHRERLPGTRRERRHRSGTGTALIRDTKPSSVLALTHLFQNKASLSYATMKG